MDATKPAAHAHQSHEVHHHEPSFMQRYISSTDHKVIGLQYGITALMFLLFGFCLMMLMRWQMAYPGKPIPVFGPCCTKCWEMSRRRRDVARPLHAFGAMHGTIMVFLAIVPLAFAPSATMWCRCKSAPSIWPSRA